MSARLGSALRLVATAVAVSIAFSSPAKAQLGGLKKALAKAAQAEKDSLAKDMAEHPYMAASFDASHDAVVKALETAFKETGYPLERSVRGYVIAKASKAEEIKDPDADKNKHQGGMGMGGLSHDKLYNMEQMTGFVHEIDKKEVVRLTYQIGTSRSSSSFLHLDPGTNRLESGGEPGTVISTDSTFYKDIMARIAKAVAKP